MKILKDIFIRMNSGMTYPQKYHLVLVFFFTMFTLLSGALIYQTQKQVNLENTKLTAIQYQKPLKNILQNLIVHQLYNYSYFKGNRDVKNELASIETAVNDNLSSLRNLNKDYGKELKTSEDELVLNNKENLKLDKILQKWEIIKTQSINFDLSKNQALHQELSSNITDLLSYVVESGVLYNNANLASVYLVDFTQIQIPELEQNILTLVNQGQDAISNKKPSEQQTADIRSSIAIVKDKLANIKDQTIALHNYIDKNYSFQELGEIGILSQMESLNSSVSELIQLIDQRVLSVPVVDLTNNDLLKEGLKAINAGFNYWDNAVGVETKLIQNNKIHLIYFGLSAIILSFLIGLIGLILGHLFVREVVRSVENLDSTIRRLTSGDLSARAEILYQDEVGKASISFNSMADNVENVISQLRNLQDATKRLANGDFSARVNVVSSSDDDLRQVAVSFNEMAQSFEEIIGQLQHMGISLTTSATEIASASKQQETIIVEQEATTREISVTASEISTTAKEFANTVSDVSKVAEETSKLAASGKESLAHMEDIMRQMVDASGSIASKLGVLNEKASNVTSVITTITKVADLTNLLSLNAAIEAEKAGEYGRSFAVIAREIRRLADQTALATLDIEKIVNEIMSAISSSVVGVDDFTQEIRNGGDQVRRVGEQLTKIIEQVQVLTSRFETVNQGMQSQSAAAEQINEAMAQLSHTAQLTTESIHQFRNTILQLNSAATELRVAMTKIMRDAPTSKTTHNTLGENKSNEDVMGLINFASNFSDNT